jgi:hypothetical protein
MVENFGAVVDPKQDYRKYGEYARERVDRDCRESDKNQWKKNVFIVSGGRQE